VKPHDFLQAARVPETLQPQSFGAWTIDRVRSTGGGEMLRPIENGRWEWSGWPSITLLYRQTLATMHLPHGDVVMEDSRRELLRHMPIWLAARGRVLVSGLGLGCVVRGLLASPAVEHVDVVELDPDVLRIVGAEFAGNPRVALHLGDARRIEWPAKARWDFAWHDIHSDEGFGHLQVLHAELIVRYAGRVTERQGAWMFPRFAKRRCLMRTELLG
jgi:hypothetical protein